MLGSKEHLDDVHENYWQHMMFAIRVSCILMTAAILLMVHAIIPGICQCSASKRIFKLADEIRARQNCSDHK